MATREQIVDALSDVALKHDVTMLAARDYGSRAKGMEGPQSDHDVFYVYLPRYTDFVAGTAAGTIYDSGPAPDDVELAGWSLRKFAGSLQDSDPNALSFVQSNLQYWVRDDVEAPLMALCTHAAKNFKPYALIGHYRSMAASNYGKYIEQSWVKEVDPSEFARYAGTEHSQVRIDEQAGRIIVGLLGYPEKTQHIPLDEAEAEGLVRQTTRDPTVKRSLVVAHALLQARFVEKTHELPPLEIEPLLDEVPPRVDPSDQVYETIYQLLESKRNGMGDTEIVNLLGDWIEDELDRDVEPQHHVGRQPEKRVISESIEEIVEEIDDE